MVVIDGYVDALQKRILHAVETSKMVPHVIKFTEAQLLQLQFSPLLHDLQETQIVWPNSENLFFRESNAIVDWFTNVMPLDYLLAPFA